MSMLIESSVSWAAVENKLAIRLAGTKKSAERQFAELKQKGAITENAKLVIVKFAVYEADEHEIKKRLEAEAVLEEIKKQKDVEG